MTKTMRLSVGLSVLAGSDFEGHNAMPYVKGWFAKLPELADGGVKVMRMQVLARH